MQEQDRAIDNKDKTVYVGIDTHLKKWCMLQFLFQYKFIVYSDFIPRHYAKVKE